MPRASATNRMRWRCAWKSATTAAACRKNWPSACSCRWCPGVRKAAASAWRSRSRSRASTVVRWCTARDRATPCSPCCCRSPWKVTPTRATPMAREARIWIVDDDRSVRFVLATALRDEGYDVDGFENAADALAALRTRPAPDLLFTDVRMPGDDGL